MSINQSYRKALDWIHSTGRFGMNQGLVRINELLNRLGNPHHNLSYLHIGGTNGKGSTAAMIASVLKASGYRAGLYTSPYLVSFTNRFSVDGEDISPRELVELVERVRPLVEQVAKDPKLGQPTEFEVVTALAFLYFARLRPDLVVLEVGLGGRLDATNVITPLVSVITNISLEHTRVLGNSVEAIACEKAEIIKPGVPVVTAAADPVALKLFSAVCRDRRAPGYRVVSARDEVSRNGWSGICTYSERKLVPLGQQFCYQGLDLNLEGLLIPLRGEHQIVNASTALAALELLSRRGFVFSEDGLRRGLKDTCWPGRLEVLGKSPPVVLDGAHNPAAMEQLARSISEHFRYRRLVLVLGILKDKDKEAMFKHILPLAYRLVLTRPAYERAASPEEMARSSALKAYYSGPLQIENEVGRALEAALKLAGKMDLVLVAGSLYTVSEAREYWLKGRGTV
ncbi:MAG TPA: bifunctional folylpolyglutamate synthase/dihydrofolate synthase [Firmicutes bacterium]|nr:bifunctional folylpolyglutamate synthase/dihydrofolate synthase [Bacillota bacterium]